MRVPAESPASSVLRDLTDADRARIDARNARLAAVGSAAEAGQIVEEDYRKVGQLYEQLNAQASLRGEAFPALDTWLRQRAQERIAQGYTAAPVQAQPGARFEAALSEAAGLAGGGPAAVDGVAARRHEHRAADVPGGEPAAGLNAVDEVLGQLALGQRGRAGGEAVDG